MPVLPRIYFHAVELPDGFRPRLVAISLWELTHDAEEEKAFLSLLFMIIGGALF